MKILINIILSMSLISCSGCQDSCEIERYAKEEIMKSCHNDSICNFRQKHYNIILDHLCKKNIGASRVLLLESSSPNSSIRDGLIYIPEKQTFFYFIFEKDGFKITDYKNDLPVLSSLLIQLSNDFIKKSDFLINKKDESLTKDPHYLDIFNIDLSHRDLSKFFTIKYYPEILNDISNK